MRLGPHQAATTLDLVRHLGRFVGNLAGHIEHHAIDGPAHDWVFGDNRAHAIERREPTMS
jgi:hypothetical protein